MTEYRPDPRILELGDGFFDPVRAASFPLHRARFFNRRWAARVGLGELTDDAVESHFARFEPLPDNLSEPLALRYHGHQFDVYNSQLGDGRGFLFAQLHDDRNRLLDLGAKGSGTTPYSRGGDGRLTLKGGVREVLATEMLEALGVHTSKSFSLFETGESLFRGDEPSPTRSSVLVRLNHSHVRIGSFQRHYAEARTDRLEKLLDYSATHLLPELGGKDNLPVRFLRAVVERSARLCAEWLVAGFVHGVLNSDNMTVTGESFDYGPYRFLPHYDPDFTAAYFDHGGLYAFGHQPRAVYRNLGRLAQSLSPLDPSASWTTALDDFVPRLRAWRARGLVERLGLVSGGVDEDEALSESVWDFLGATGASYDGVLFDSWGGPAGLPRALRGPRRALYEDARFAPLRARLEAATPLDPSRLELSYFNRDEPCHLVIDEIERIWQAIDERDDWQPFDDKVADIREAGAALRLDSERLRASVSD